MGSSFSAACSKPVRSFRGRGKGVAVLPSHEQVRRGHGPAPFLPRCPPPLCPAGLAQKEQRGKKRQDGGWGKVTHGSDGSCPPSIACRKPSAEEQSPTGCRAERRKGGWKSLPGVPCASIPKNDNTAAHTHGVRGGARAVPGSPRSRERQPQPSTLAPGTSLICGAVPSLCDRDTFCSHKSESTIGADGGRDEENVLFINTSLLHRLLNLRHRYDQKCLKRAHTHGLAGGEPATAGSDPGEPHRPCGKGSSCGPVGSVGGLGVRISPRGLW